MPEQPATMRSTQDAPPQQLHDISGASDGLLWRLQNEQAGGEGIAYCTLAGLQSREGGSCEQFTKACSRAACAQQTRALLVAKTLK
jgi:hypothetical protein